jgi:L-histidine N-alpha-methyltransferase
MRNYCEQITIQNLLGRVGNGEHREKIIQGLKSTAKYIPSMFFYDHHGSELFEELNL